MRLRWSIGLPGPFYLSGNVFPRGPRKRRRWGKSGGGGLIGLFFLGIFWAIIGELILVYWFYLALIGLIWWGIGSAIHKRLVPWPVPSHAWTFWRRASTN